MQAVVEGDEYETAASEGRPVVDGGRSAATHEGTAVDPHHDRASPVVGGWRPDIDEQAVLVDRFAPAERGVDTAELSKLTLGADRAERRGITHALPCGWRRRWAVAAFAHGRGRIRHTPEDESVVARLATHQACGRTYHVSHRLIVVHVPGIAPLRQQAVVPRLTVSFQAEGERNMNCSIGARSASSTSSIRMPRGSR